ncbi:rhodanese family protein [Sphingobium sp.]|uniref:rhodanese family protein n=1 Tax=Sphingobium sp. TaxID=1912891 RepID=UPI002E202661
MAISTLTAAQARIALNSGATLIDVRDPDEHAREHIEGAINRPLTRLDDEPLPDGPLIFHCRSGMRTGNCAPALEAAAKGAPCSVLDGGIDAWRAGGFPTIVDRTQPLEIGRQVQLAAGGLVLLGVLLGWFVAPAFLLLAGFVGTGLMFAGATGWCGLAHLFRRMPWNRATV